MKTSGRRRYRRVPPMRASVTRGMKTAFHGDRVRIENAIDRTMLRTEDLGEVLTSNGPWPRSGEYRMNIKRITAIVPIDTVETLEKNLRARGVPGITVEYVQGFGKHPNFFRRDLMKDNARVVVYAEENRVDEIVDAIARCAHQCAYSGILAVESIDRLVRLPSGGDVTPSALSDHEDPQ